MIVLRLLSATVHLLAPGPGVAGVGTCKYHPTCSVYAGLAIRKHGPVKGLALAGWRLLRCNPWSHGGVDFP